MTESDFYERLGKRQREITIERYRHLNKHVIKGQIVFAGSSLAEQFPVNEMLQSKALPYIVYNRGVSGDTIEGLIADLDTLIYDLAPSKLFINIGSNNIGGEHYNENTLYRKYTGLIEAINKAMPLCKIHVLSYYPVNPHKESFLDETSKKFMFVNRTNKNIQYINKRMQDYCNNNDLSYINVHDTLIDDGYLDESLTVEGIHLWPNAYELILDILIPYFS